LEKGSSVSRKSERPDGDGCKQGGWRSRHQWEHSNIWNGNDRRVLPFWTGTRGIARAGWRCYHCGKMAWDQSDLEFKAAFAVSVGLIKLPEAEEVVRTERYTA
jgi:hypothetical protein